MFSKNCRRSVSGDKTRLAPFIVDQGQCTHLCVLILLTVQPNTPADRPQKKKHVDKLAKGETRKKQRLLEKQPSTRRTFYRFKNAVPLSRFRRMPCALRKRQDRSNAHREQNRVTPLPKNQLTFRTTPRYTLFIFVFET